MKLCILGASGGVGKKLVELAKARGHEVTAVTRPSSNWTVPSGVRHLKGDLTSEMFLREAVRGHDAVLSALGPKIQGLAPWHKPEVPDFIPQNSAALVKAMEAENVRRLVAISSGGVGDSTTQVPGFFRFFAKVTALRHAFVELDKMEQEYLKSGLSVCVVRPPGLTNGPLTGTAKVVDQFIGRAAMSRADVADFMLKEALNATSAVKTPLLSAN